MMFAGMIRVESKSISHKNDNKCHQCAVTSDGPSVMLESDSCHRRTFRRPGYVRAEPLGQVDTAVSLAGKTSCNSNRNSEIPNSEPSTKNTGPSISKLPSSPCEKWLKEVFEKKDNSLNNQTTCKTHSLHNLEETRTFSSGDVFNSSFSFIQQSLETCDLLATSELAPSHYVHKRSESTPWDQPKSEPSDSGILKSCTVLVNQSMFEDDSLSQSKISPVSVSQSGPEVVTLGQPPCSIDQSVKQKGLLLDEELWLVDLSWCQRDTQISSSMASDFKESVHDSDTEVTSSLSVDSSDFTSASSVTSGYDSATPSSDQSHGGLMKKHEDILQDCLQNTRTNTKMQSMMLKLHRLQHRAVLEDDYDAAERFGKKLEDLSREQATLKPGLPSRHPTISGYLEQLRNAVHSALQGTNTHCSQNVDLSEDQRSPACSIGQHQTRDSLIQEKQRIEKEMHELQRRLEELQEQSRAVEMQLVQEEQRLELEVPVLQEEQSLELEVLVLQEEQRLELEVPVLQEEQRLELEVPVLKEERSLELEVPVLQEERSLELEVPVLQEEQSLEAVLRSCDATQLQLMGRALENIISSKHRAQISMSPPEEIIRLQKQELALSLSIKEATAKVVMSQKLGGSLRRKVSEIETQLLALHEAKLAAVTGNDFSSAKELKAEIRSVYGERDRLEALERKLHALSTGSGEQLTRMKEQHKQIKLDLQRREAQYKRSLRENTQKYIKLLEDQRHSCGSPALEHIWEADLEACHLLLKGLELHPPSLSEMEDFPPVSDSSSLAQSFPKEQADCAMLTALGGRWCPEANLQYSEFTKKLEEFLFCLEDSPPEGLCGEAEELTEQCELISERLHYLEDQLQIAMENHDKDLTLSLEKEVLEVKAMLHAMLSQLKHEDDEEEDDEDKYCDVEEEQVEDIEEELYFSDSWEM